MIDKTQPLRDRGSVHTKSAGSTTLDWRIPYEDEPWDDPDSPRDEEPAGGSPTGRRMRGIAGLLVLLLAGAGLYWWRVAEQGAQRLEVEVRMAVAAEQWFTSRPHPGPGNRTRPVATVQVQGITFHGNIADVQVATTREGSNGRRYISHQRTFYQPTASGWVRVAPDDEFLGPRRVRQTEFFTLHYRKADATAVAAVASELDILYTDLRHDYTLPPAAQRLVVKVGGFRPVQDGGSPCFFGAGALCISSPALVAIPDGLTEEQVLYLWTLNALVDHVRREAQETDPSPYDWPFASVALSRLQMRRHSEWLASWHTDLVQWLYSADAEEQQADHSAHIQALRNVCIRHRIPERSHILNGMAKTYLCGVSSGSDSMSGGALLVWHKPPERLTEFWRVNPESLAPSDYWDYVLIFETVLDYALAAYGPDVLPALVDGFRHYDTWGALIPAVFGVSFEEFDRGWQRYVLGSP